MYCNTAYYTMYYVLLYPYKLKISQIRAEGPSNNGFEVVEMTFFTYTCKFEIIEYLRKYGATCHGSTGSQGWCHIVPTDTCPIGHLSNTFCYNRHLSNKTLVQ